MNLRLLSITLTILLFSSCSYYNKCSRSARKIERAIELCPEIESKSIDTVTIKVPEVRDSLIYLSDTIIGDTVINMIQRGDTTELIKLVNRPCITDTIRKETDRYSLKIWQTKNRIETNLVLKEILKQETVQTQILNPIQPKKMPLTGWQSFQIWSGSIFWILIIIGGLIFIRKLLPI